MRPSVLISFDAYTNFQYGNLASGFWGQVAFALVTAFIVAFFGLIGLRLIEHAVADLADKRERKGGSDMSEDVKHTLFPQLGYGAGTFLASDWLMPSRIYGQPAWSLEDLAALIAARHGPQVKDQLHESFPLDQVDQSPPQKRTERT